MDRGPLPRPNLSTRATTGWRSLEEEEEDTSILQTLTTYFSIVWPMPLPAYIYLNSTSNSACQVKALLCPPPSQKPCTLGVDSNTGLLRRLISYITLIGRRDSTDKIKISEFVQKVGGWTLDFVHLSCLHLITIQDEIKQVLSRAGIHKHFIPLLHSCCDVIKHVTTTNLGN
jgi:hypothetical protein